MTHIYIYNIAYLYNSFYLVCPNLFNCFHLIPRWTGCDQGFTGRPLDAAVSRRPWCRWIGWFTHSDWCSVVHLDSMAMGVPQNFDGDFCWRILSTNGWWYGGSPTLGHPHLAIYIWFIHYHRIGWWETLQETPYLRVKTHGFL